MDKPVQNDRSFLPLRRILSTSTFGVGMAALLVGGMLAPVFDYAKMGVSSEEVEAVYRESLGFTSNHQTEGEVAPMLDENGCEALVWDSTRALPASESEYAAERLSFSVKVGGNVIPYSLMLISAMPGETIEMEAIDNRKESTFSVTADEGNLQRLKGNRWKWQAPKNPGMGCIRVARAGSDEAICINAFVMRPYSGGEYLNGYRIGNYQAQPLNANPAYNAPRGFIEVTPELENAWVSPHFQLRQFVCKQTSGYPKYMVLQTRLIMKLEMLLEELNRRGIPATSFYIVSGYRTPWYNAYIGNASTYSRHTYGDAADFLVDVNRDGVFDNIDGRAGISAEDVLYVQNVVDQLELKGVFRTLIGGFGLYEPIPGERGPFAHIDARGHLARWVVKPGDEADEVDSIESVVARDTLLKEEASSDRSGSNGGSAGSQLPEKKKPGENTPATNDSQNNDGIRSEDKSGEEGDTVRP